MRVGWATPFNIRSAIGKFSRFVCEELTSRGHEIEIIRIEPAPDLHVAPLETAIPIVNAADCNVSDYDLLVVNFGNHAAYHAEMLGLIAQRPPLGVFHDIEMRHFEWGLQYSHGVSVPRLIASEGDTAADADLVDPQARPLLGAFAAMTCGAVIHGPHYQHTVAEHCPGPVELIAFCYPDTGNIRASLLQAPIPRVTIFGMINEHKQPRRVLRALGLLKDRSRPIELHLAGHVDDDYRYDLIEEAHTLGIGLPIFHGYVSDEDLQDLLELTHVTCCLRYPVTEGSSASLVTALHRARPLIIPDIASFSLVPDELAYKVSYGEDPRDVAEALHEIFSRPDEAQQKGWDAKNWAEDRFSACCYADALEPVMRSVQKHEPLVRAARKLVPAVTSPSNEPIMPALQAFSHVLDWMEASQR
jgi:glycosyltransferase involved in cell wall biosynthesis